MENQGRFPARKVPRNLAKVKEIQKKAKRVERKKAARKGEEVERKGGSPRFIIMDFTV